MTEQRIEVWSRNKLATAATEWLHDKNRTGNARLEELCTHTDRKSLQCKVWFSLLYAFRNKNETHYVASKSNFISTELETEVRLFLEVILD
jgi:hypothetical protein